MIDIADLRKGDIGAWVEHRGEERGRIKSWNNEYIFVVFKCGGEWTRFRDFTGVATKPSDLEFVNHLTGGSSG